MAGTKGRIRADLRAARARRPRGLDAAGERSALVARWGEVLALLGVSAHAGGRLPALFVPTASEPDVSGIITASARCLLPVLVDAAGVALPEPAWAIHEGDPTSGLWSPSPRRPAQPVGEVLAADALRDASVVLVAALAVDHSGTRLGQGGGWYDRALLHRAAGVPVVAAVLDGEVLPGGALPREPHDLGVDAVITPSGVRLLG